MALVVVWLTVVVLLWAAKRRAEENLSSALWFWRVTLFLWVAAGVLGALISVL